jgi:hypothetical protein
MTDQLPLAWWPVGADNVVDLCNLRIRVLVDQAAQPLAAASGQFADGPWCRGSRDGSGLSEGAMRPVPVVVIDIDGEHVAELAAVDDQSPVQQFAA